jgi:hypothetical protein
MPPDVAGFLERFRAFGEKPCVASYLPLFHPDATLFDSGMERPIRVPEIPEHIEGVLKLIPDFQMTPERWRERGGTVFVEATNRASLGDRTAEWDSVYCVDLVGDRVIRGRRYYDRRPLFALLNPSLPALPAIAPGPRDHRLLARLLPGLSLELEAWAGDDSLLFFEWTARATVGGAPIAVGVAERVDRAAGPATCARSYFDTLALATRLAAARA